LAKGEIVNSPNLLPLKEWAKRQYGDFAPHRNTLLKWVRDGRIQPQPEKQGRAYFFKPEAKYK